MSDQPQTSPSETPPADVPGSDALVARGFWRSLAVVVLIAGAITVFKLTRTPTAPAGGSVAPVQPPADPPVRAGSVQGVAFRDVTAAAGVDFIHESGARGAKLLPECLAGGVALGDLDVDGRLDLVFTQAQPLEPKPEDRAAGQGGVRIYLNRSESGGPLRFERLAGDEAIAPDCFANGVAIGDLDGDRMPDLYIACVGQDRALRCARVRDGTPFYEPIAVPVESNWGSSVGMVDADADGDLDVVVANYVAWSPAIDRAVHYTLDGVGRAYGPPTGFEGSAIALLINDHGTLRDATSASGVAVRNPVGDTPYAKALGLLFLDADRDHRTDILVANDRTPKFLLRSDGPAADGTPRFHDIGVETGLAFDRDGNATGAMGIDAAWIRNATQLAVLVGNFANEPSSLYLRAQREGSAQFSDDALGEGVGAPTRRMLTFGALFVDVDLDGDQDIVQANGHLEPEIARFAPSQTYAQPGQLLINRGELGASTTPLFADAGAASIGDLAVPAVGRALACGDLDGDGDDDLVLVDLGGRARILANEQATGNHWIACDGPVGTEVEIVTTEGGALRTQRATICPTRSYQSQCEQTARFGLGIADRVDLVRARFTDGTTREWRGVPADARLSLTDPN